MIQRKTRGRSKILQYVRYLLDTIKYSDTHGLSVHYDLSLSLCLRPLWQRQRQSVTLIKLSLKTVRIHTVTNNNVDSCRISGLL